MHETYTQFHVLKWMRKKIQQSTPSPNLHGILKQHKSVCPGTMQEVNYVLSVENKRLRENTWNSKAALNSVS